MSFCAKLKGEVAESNNKEDIPHLWGEGLHRLRNDWILQLQAKALRAE